METKFTLPSENRNIMTGILWYVTSILLHIWGSVSHLINHKPYDARSYIAVRYKLCQTKLLYSVEKSVFVMYFNRASFSFGAFLDELVVLRFSRFIYIGKWYFGRLLNLFSAVWTYKYHGISHQQLPRFFMYIPIFTCTLNIYRIIYAAKMPYLSKYLSYPDLITMDMGNLGVSRHCYLYFVKHFQFTVLSFSP